MKIESLHVGMRCGHPQYGIGIVRTFPSTPRKCGSTTASAQSSPASAGLEPAELKWP